MKTTNAIALSHNQEIRIADFTHANRIRVFTISGYAIENREDPAAAIARSKSFGHCLNPDTIQDCACLTSDYPGKHAELDAAAAATAAAPEIADGQIVEIEGQFFKVRVRGQRYSDPVAFVPAATDVRS